MMKSRARTTATGVSVGLTIGALVGACTSLPEITAAPTDAGTETSADVGSATDAGDPALSAACKTFLAANGPPGRWAFGPVAGSAVTYVESDKGVPEIAWVGMCEGADKPTVYRTPLDGFAPSKDAITRFPAGDLCVGANPFGAARIPLPKRVDVVSLVPSDRNPKFLCALVAGNGIVAPPFGQSTVGCFSSDPKATTPDPISGNFVALFRSREFGPATIRAAYGGSSEREVNTFVVSAGADGTVAFSPTVMLAQKVPAGSTAAIASTGALSDDSFVLFDEVSGVVTRFASDGKTASTVGTAGSVPKTPWGETIFGDLGGTTLVAGLEGAMNGQRLRPRVSIVLPKGDASYRAVTDLTTADGLNTYGLVSGGFERMALVSGTNAAGTGAAILAVRGVDNNNAPLSAFVFAEAAKGTLLPSTAKSARIPALPTSYGLTGSIPTATGGKPSIYVGISADAMAGWSKGVCTSGMIAAFEPQ